ncbi:phenylacetyl-CoA ligase, partial [Hygrophoropsis aurantiaca]
MLGSPPQNAADDDVPWFIDAITGETRTRAQVKILADSLARGLRTHFRFQRDYSDIATTQTFDLQSSSSPSQNRTKGSKYNIGSVVSIVSPNNVDFGACVWACHKIGCTVAPSNAGSTVDELTHQFRLTGAQVIITHPNAFSSVLRAARAVGIPDGRIVVLGNREVISDDLAGFLTIQDLVDINITAGDPSDNISAECQIAFLCFSSGTTGLPKAVVIPHEAVIANVNQVASTAIPGSRASPGDKALGVIPLSHMYGLLTLLHLCPHLGISSVLYPGMPPFEPFLDSLENLRVNHLFLAPPLVNAFLKHPAAQGRDLSFFKTCLVAAAPLDADREDAFRNLCGPNLLLSQAFGMTETAGLVTSLFPGAQPISGTVGRLVPSTEAKILDSEGRPVSAGERGELFVRGPQLCLGYLNNENENRLAFDDQGFLRTGDEVVMLPSGDIRVMDRLKNIIKHKGFQVSPAELEGHILLHPFVEDVGVVGRPDERAGETPVAFVVLSSSGKDAAQFDEDHVKDTIQDHVRRAKSQYKWLGDVFFVNAIPRLPSGKILLRELR